MLTAAALTVTWDQGVGSELPRAAGAPDRIMPCRGGSGAPAKILGSKSRWHVFGTAGASRFLARAQIKRRTVLRAVLKGPMEML
jgi:hypothetical protein